MLDSGKGLIHVLLLHPAEHIQQKPDAQTSGPIYHSYYIIYTSILNSRFTLSAICAIYSLFVGRF